jgi:hypothetical protein
LSQTVTDAGVVKVLDDDVRGLIVELRNATLPAGWQFCDGTNGTPDLRDRFVVGDTALGTGAAAGTQSVTAALTHTGAAVGAHSAHAVTQAAAHSAHVTTQPAAHSSHVVTQPAAHANHALNATHTHDAHVGHQWPGSTRPRVFPTAHAANVAHAHDAHSAHTASDLDAHSAHTGASVDAHSAHSGAALDAHSAHGVTQPDSHGVPKHWELAYVMRL